MTQTTLAAYFENKVPERNMLVMHGEMGKLLDAIIAESVLYGALKSGMAIAATKGEDAEMRVEFNASVQEKVDVALMQFLKENSPLGGDSQSLLYDIEKAAEKLFQHPGLSGITALGLKELLDKEHINFVFDNKTGAVTAHRNIPNDALGNGVLKDLSLSGISYIPHYRLKPSAFAA